MFILQGSGLLGSSPTGPGSGYSLMARIFDKTAHTCRISLIIHKAAQGCKSYKSVQFPRFPIHVLVESWHGGSRNNRKGKSITD